MVFRIGLLTIRDRKRWATFNSVVLCKPPQLGSVSKKWIGAIEVVT